MRVPSGTAPEKGDHKEKTEMKTEYIVRSATNPNLILATNGEFLAHEMIGPGHRLGAKLYKTSQGASQVREGAVIVEKVEDECLTGEIVHRPSKLASRVDVDDVIFDDYGSTPNKVVSIELLGKDFIEFHFADGTFVAYRPTSHVRIQVGQPS